MLRMAKKTAKNPPRAAAHAPRAAVEAVVQVYDADTGKGTARRLDNGQTIEIRIEQVKDQQLTRFLPGQYVEVVQDESGGISEVLA